MIDQNNLISKAREWYQEEYAVSGGDLLLSAFVSLRLISAEFLELSSSTKSDSQKFRSEILSKLLNTELNTWEKDWLPKFEDGLLHTLLISGLSLKFRRNGRTSSAIPCQLLRLASPPPSQLLYSATIPQSCKERIYSV